MEQEYPKQCKVAMESKHMSSLCGRRDTYEGGYHKQVIDTSTPL